MTIERRRPVLLERAAAKRLVCLAPPEPQPVRARAPAARRMERQDLEQVVRLGLSKAGLDQAWDDLMPAGNRLRHLDSAIDENGEIRFAAVFEPGKQKQRFVADFALEDSAEDYGTEWAMGHRFATLSVVWTPAGPRYTGIWNPDADGQVVMWLHMRERIFEVYNEMWCQGFKLRSLHTVGV